MNPFLLLVSSIFVNNILLIKFLALCSFFGLSNQIKNAFGMSLAVLFVMLVSTAVTWLVYNLVLVPKDIVFLRTAVFILTIAALVQLEEMFIKKYSKPLYDAMGIYLPLITTNCAILAVTFLSIDYGLGFIKSIIYALGVGIGYGIAIVIFAAIRGRLFLSTVPKSLEGYPIAFFLASLMSLAFLGFKGLFGL
ncbi:MAG: RnfABCDGE type electron transport complex subunit A [Elusimicrobiota bacterium]